MLPLSAAVDSASVCSMAEKTKVYCCMIHGLFVAGQPHFFGLALMAGPGPPLGLRLQVC